MKEWIQLDNQIKEVSADVKEVRKRHSDLRKKVLEYMEKNEIGKCTLFGGDEELCMNTRERKVKPNKTEMLRRMAEFLNDRKKASDLFDMILEPIEVTTSTCLMRRSVNKGIQKKREMEIEQTDFEDDE